MNRKEWLIIIFSLTLLLSGAAYYFLSPDYHEYFIHDTRSAENIWEVPRKSGNNALVIKVEGYSSDDYSLKLNYYHKDEKNRASFRRTYSEVIRFPAGDINGTLKRDFYGSPDNSKVNITYVPGASATSKGVVKLKVGIF